MPLKRCNANPKSSAVSNLATPQAPIKYPLAVYPLVYPSSFRRSWRYSWGVPGEKRMVPLGIGRSEMRGALESGARRGLGGVWRPV